MADNERLTDAQLSSIFSALNQQNTKTVPLSEILSFLQLNNVCVDNKTVCQALNRMQLQDKNGGLTEQEFLQFFHTLCPQYCMSYEEQRALEEAPHKTRRQDTIKKSPVQSYEVKSLRKQHYTDSEITALFVQLDKQRVGRVGLNQLVLALQKNGISIDHRQCYEYLDQFGSQVEGDQLTLEQFIQLFKCLLPDKCDDSSDAVRDATARIAERQHDRQLKETLFLQGQGIYNQNDKRYYSSVPDKYQRFMSGGSYSPTPQADSSLGPTNTSQRGNLARGTSKYGDPWSNSQGQNPRIDQLTQRLDVEMRKLGNMNNCAQLSNYKYFTIEEVDKIFGQIDQNGDGYISVDELMLFFARQKADVSHKQVFGILRRFDADQDGRLGAGEFRELFSALFASKMRYY